MLDEKRLREGKELTLSPHTTMKSSWHGLWATDMTVNGTAAVLNLWIEDIYTCTLYTQICIYIMQWS